MEERLTVDPAAPWEQVDTLSLGVLTVINMVYNCEYLVRPAFALLSPSLPIVPHSACAQPRDLKQTVPQYLRKATSVVKAVLGEMVRNPNYAKGNQPAHMAVISA